MPTSNASVDKVRATSLKERLFRPVDIAFLVYFRVCFGLLAAWLMWIFFDVGAIEKHYIIPKLHFTYYGFDWVRPWPGNGMYWHFAVLGASALCIACGLFTRVASVTFGLGFAYVFLLEQARYMNHFYLLILLSLLLSVLPVQRSFSIDALMRPGIRSNVAPAWTLWLLRIQFGLVYFYAGIAKLDPDWLQGAPLKMMLAEKTDVIFIGPYVHEPWAIFLMTYGSLLLDLFVFPLLLWRRTRVFALVCATGFHLLNTQLFIIDIFPWLMTAATVILFFPDWLPYRSSNSERHESDHADSRQIGRPSLTRRQKLTAALVGLYLLIQLLLPLRYLLYSGNTNWTNQGNLFAWRMLLRHKAGSKPHFDVSYRKDGQIYRTTIHVPDDPAVWWYHWQFRKMVITPDLMLQFCHMHARELERLGCEDVDIRARVLVSLNGRKPQDLIDPTVNLAAQPRDLWPAEWIVPLREPLPPAPWD